MVNEKIKVLKKPAQRSSTYCCFKNQTAEMIQQGMKSGHLDFGESKVQELVHKHASLPKNIRWHMIGHLQRNKVKHIAPFIYLIHGADSKKLLDEINKQAFKNNKTINCLLQFHIASESTKFGFSIEEIRNIIDSQHHLNWENINFKGVMGMATFTNNKNQIKAEFSLLKEYFEELKPIFGKNFKTLSMGMSGDYLEAISKGSNMIRIGSNIFGKR